MTDQHPDDRGQQRSAPSRVPPHNVDAEASLLGAALVHPVGVTALVDRVTASDFYKPQHRHVAAAILALVETDDAVDVVTVANRLRIGGLLDEIGGVDYLHQLQNDGPSISAAPTYAGIISDCARARRMLHAAADLADAAYRETDPLAALTRAQNAIGALAVDGESGSTLDIADVAALLATDLKPERALYLTRSDGLALLYAGKIHCLQAEPSSGKSWIAALAIAEVLELGGHAVCMDHEDTAVGWLGRLLAIGCKPAAIAARFHYLQPVGAHGPVERAQLNRLLDDVNPDLVIIDGVGESLSRNGLSEDKADDILKWSDMLPRPIAATGATVLMIDHVAKDPEQRGRWARGSGAKLGAVDGATYQVKVVQPFSRKKAGGVKLVIAKDRPGGVGAIGDTAAVITIEPHGDGERVVLTVGTDTATLPATDRHKPTMVMAQIAHEIETATVRLTSTALRALIPQPHDRTFSEALARLISEGFVTESTRRPKTLRLVRPYHGESSRAEPVVEPEPDPQLFTPIDEPAWMADDSRAYLDQLATDPTL